MVRHGEPGSAPTAAARWSGATRSAHCEPTAARSIRKRRAAARTCSVVAISMLVAGAACADPRCPKGYWQYGDTCYRMKDAGASAGTTLEPDADPAIVRDASSAGPGQGVDAAGLSELQSADGPDAEGTGDAAEEEVSPMDSGACSGGDCPECDDENACTGAHEICVDGRCVVQPYCGDGMKGADEECDPMHPSWDAWTCNETCKITATYTACSGNERAARGLWSERDVPAGPMRSQMQPNRRLSGDTSRIEGKRKVFR
jgi:hypothetical protein